MRHDFDERVKRAARELQLQLLRWDEIRLSSAARFLVKNLIPSVGVVVVYGPPKCGKTFWLFDLVMHVALGWWYRGLRTQRGTVVYCLFEGQINFAARVEAFRQSRLAEHAEDVPFFLMPMKLELVKDHESLIKAIRRQTGDEPPRAVVLDTLNRSFTGSESSDTDMTNYVRACDAIRDAFDCATIIVHHSGLEGGRSRGHTSLLGAVDAQIGVERDKAENVIASVEYMKDGPADARITSRLKVVEVGTDDDGEPITSCIIEPTEGDASSKSAGPARRPNRAHSTFRDAFNDEIIVNAQRHRVGGDGPVVAAANLVRVHEIFAQRYCTGEVDKRTAQKRISDAWRGALNALVPHEYQTESKGAQQWIWRL